MLILDISAIPAVPSTPSNTKSSSTLSTNDFYKLLAAEMQYQDPTSDSSGSGGSGSGDYITELAILSATSAVQAMTKIENYALGASLQGGAVAYTDTSTAASGKEETSTKTGVIEAADLTGDSPRFYVATSVSGAITGKWINYSDISQIYAPNVTDNADPSGTTGTTGTTETTGTTGTTGTTETAT